MSNYESLFWELCLLAFLGLLYYLYQRKRILSPKNPKDLLSSVEWSMLLYELHSFLEEELKSKNYESLNESALKLEDAYIHKDMPIFSQELLRIYDYETLPKDLKVKIEDLIERL